MIPKQSLDTRLSFMLQFRMFAAAQFRSAFPPSQLRALGDLSVKNPPSLDSDFYTPRGPSAKSGQNNSFQFSVLRTLPSSVSRNSFVCHSYENCRVYTNNSHFGSLRAQPREISPLAAYSSPFFSYSCALFCTHKKLNSFPFKRFRTLCQRTPWVGEGVAVQILKKNF